MVSSDTVVGIVGAVILTGAMIAVFYIEADREDVGPGADLGEGSQTFAFRFTENMTMDPENEDRGPLAEGEPDDIPLQTQPYTFRVFAEVEWAGHDLEDSPAMGSPEFRIDLIEGETGGETENVLQSSSETESPELEFEPNDNKSAPERMNLTVAANDQAEARGFVTQYMQEDETVQQSMRDWTIRVTLVDDGLVADNPLSGEQDVEHGYSITVHIEYWYPELREE